MSPLALILCQLINPAGDSTLADFERGLEIPKPGFHELRVVTPKVLELFLVNTQDQPGDFNGQSGTWTAPLTRPTIWDIHNPVTQDDTLPEVGDFEVQVNGQKTTVAKVGFKRQAAYAPFESRDLRINNSIFLFLDQAVPAEAAVKVVDGPAAKHTYVKELKFEAVASANRYGSAIHVNQVGYVPSWPGAAAGPKKAHVGYFLGDLGELKADGSMGLSPDTGFEIIREDNHQVVFQKAKMELRKDSNFASYQNVLEADFSEFTTPGRYRLRLAGLGASMPFWIDQRVAANFARAYALGHYHQRSGAAKSLPYTRFTDPAGHTAPATMPFDSAQYKATYHFMGENSGSIFARMASDPDAYQHPAPQVRSADDLLFPFVGDVIAWWPLDNKVVISAGELVEGFNNLNYSDSAITDPFNGLAGVNAFGKVPARGNFRLQDDFRNLNQENTPGGDVRGFLGRGFLNTYFLPALTQADYDKVGGKQNAKPENFPSDPLLPTGILRTKTFTVATDKLTFLIGGTNQPYDLAKGGEQRDVTAINLIIDGQLTRTATGTGKNQMEWVTWDLAAFQKKPAYLEIIDSSTTGYIMVDEIAQSTQDGLQDVASRRRHATRQGAPTFSDRGKVGDCLVFDGVDDYVRTPNLPELTDLTVFTLSAWFKIDNLQRSQVLLSTAAEGDTAGLAIWFDSAKRALIARLGALQIEGPANSLGNNDWHFLALTFQGGQASGLKLFADHTLVGAKDTTAMPKLAIGDQPIVMGNFTNRPGQYFLQGCLDDLRLRANVISAAELLETAGGSGPWVDVSTGHFDAGDYSKYMINSAQLVNALAFAVDHMVQVPGTGGAPDPLDNLGLPESGDGICDLIQEAKWEADYIAKMQDTDGGFFFLVYPRERAYELDVLPSKGDRQVVWPKTLSATGSAVGALAQLASSPAFKRHYQTASIIYMQKALKGWDFIERAVAEHGLDGAYQYLTHYGQFAEARDEIAWAAAAMFAATGDAKYEKRLKEWLFFNPKKEFDRFLVGWRDFRRYTWQRAFEAVGCAMRVYAFAQHGARANSAAVPSTELHFEGQTYRQLIEGEILAWGDDLIGWAEAHPYRTSFSIESKKFKAASYHFPESEAFDLAAAYLLAPANTRQKYFDPIIPNVDYQLGGNPVSISFVSGLGWRPQRQHVSQYAANDERQLPPIGFTTGSMNGGPPYLARYQQLLGYLTYPTYEYEPGQVPAGTPNFPLYDRYVDSWHPGNEFTVPLHARGLATMAYLQSLTAEKATAWAAPPTVTIKGIPTTIKAGNPILAEVIVPDGVSLHGTRIVWEAPGNEPGTGTSFTFVPRFARQSWIELEVLWPDGRRSFARTEFNVTLDVNRFIEEFQPTLGNPPADFYERIAAPPEVRFYFPLDGDLKDVKKSVVLSKLNPADQYDFELAGKASFDPAFFNWPSYAQNRPKVSAVRLHGDGDELRFRQADEKETTVYSYNVFPAGTKWLSVEALLYIDGFDNKDKNFADLLTIDLPYHNPNVRLQLYKDPYGGPLSLHFSEEDGGRAIPVDHAIPLQQWFHLRFYLDEKEATAFVDGKKIASVPSQDLANFTKKENWTLSVRCTNFIGWVNDILLKSSVNPEAAAPYPRWKQSLWKPRDLENPERGADGHDLDRDGLANIWEYAFGLDPDKKDTKPEYFPLVKIVADQTGAPALSVRQGTTNPDVVFAVQHSPDLRAWADYAPAIPATGTVHGDGTATLLFSGINRSENPGFFRLMIRGK